MWYALRVPVHGPKPCHRILQYVLFLVLLKSAKNVQLFCILPLQGAFLQLRSDFPSMIQKHVTEYSFTIWPISVREFQVESTWAQTADQSAQMWKDRLEKAQTKWWPIQFKWAFCFFIWFCYKNSKLIATAARRNSLSSCHITHSHNKGLQTSCGLDFSFTQDLV